MANRLAFDIGLHLDCRSDVMPEQESRIRRMAMRAAIIYDKYWSLFLGRPLSIKTQDVSMDLLSNRFSMLTSGLMDAPKRDMVTEVYEQLIELMEFAGQIVESRNPNAGNSNNPHDQFNMFAAGEAEDNAYLHVIKLDRQLQNWYRRLPEHLQWKPANIKTAPYSFFLLHQQYHVTMILLHRPWAKYGSITGDGASTGSHPSPDNGQPAMSIEPILASLGMDHSMGMGMGLSDSHSVVHESRIRCTNQAVRVARIFWQHRQRFDGRKIFVTGMQHAGTAAIALIAALAYERNEADRRTYVGYLEVLSDAVGDMSHTYHPGQRMDDLLKAVLDQIRSSMGEPPRARSGSTSYQGVPIGGRSGVSVNSDTSSSAVPLRREAEDSDFGPSSKRRRPGNSRRASEFARPPPPFFPGSLTQQTPPGSLKKQTNLRPSSMNQQNHQLDTFLFSMGVGENSFDFLNGTAIDIDPLEDAPDGHMGRADPMNLVLPTSETWGLDSMHSDTHGHTSTSFDAPMAEWPSGPILGHNGPIGSNLMPEPHFAPKDSGDGTEKDMNQNNIDKGDQSKAPGMGQKNGGEWNDGEGLSPVDLNGLVQDPGKLSHGENDANGANRNFNLDFFSFS